MVHNQILIAVTLLLHTGPYAGERNLTSTVAFAG